MDCLLKAGADPDATRGFTSPLQNACQQGGEGSGHTECIRLLRAAGADADQVKGQTHVASCVTQDSRVLCERQTCQCLRSARSVDTFFKISLAQQNSSTAPPAKRVDLPKVMQPRYYSAKSKCQKSHWNVHKKVCLKQKKTAEGVVAQKTPEAAPEEEICRSPNDTHRMKSIDRFVLDRVLVWFCAAT